MTRIARHFQQRRQRCSLIPYLTVDDAALTTERLLALAEAGAGLIELGLPFSDPVADGPALQKIHAAAVQRGIGLSQLLQAVHDFRRHNTHTPLLLMSYSNPLYRYGYTQSAAALATAGIDAVLLVDADDQPYAWLHTLVSQQLGHVGMLAPSSGASRRQWVYGQACAMVYAVAQRGITGQGLKSLQHTRSYLASLRSECPHPLITGFGLAEGEQLQQLADVVDGIVVGSALLPALRQGSDALYHATRALAAHLD